MKGISNQNGNMWSEPTSCWHQSEYGSVGVKWTDHGDVGDQALHGKRGLGIKNWNMLKIGTCNVRGVLEIEKGNVVENSIKSYGILGISETQWKDKGYLSPS